MEAEWRKVKSPYHRSRPDAAINIKYLTIKMVMEIANADNDKIPKIDWRLPHTNKYFVFHCLLISLPLCSSNVEWITTFYTSPSLRESLFYIFANLLLYPHHTGHGWNLLFDLLFLCSNGAASGVMVLSLVRSEGAWNGNFYLNVCMQLKHYFSLFTIQWINRK